MTTPDHRTFRERNPRPRTTSWRGPNTREVRREVRPALPRYRNEIGKFGIRRASECADCGRCVETCGYGVHVRPEGYRHVIRPFDYRCIGPDCEETGRYCIDACPARRLSLSDNPVFETMGDYRWTPDLLASTWAMAETGRPPGRHLESEIGASGGGFDRLRFRFPDVAARRPAAGRHFDATAAQSPRRFPAEDHDRRPLVRRRHVVRFDQHPRLAGQGAGGQGVQHLHLHGRGRLSGSLHPLRGPRDHAGGHGAVRRSRGDDPAGADRGVQVRPGGQAGAGRPPAGRQEHAERGGHARDGRRRLAVLPVPVPQRLLGRRPQEAPRLDRARQPAGAALGQGLDAGRRGHGRRGRLLRRGPHRAPRRQLRRHGRRAEHRQEEHRHADRVRHRPRAPVPGGRGHPRPDHGDRQRRHPHARRRRQGHRPGRRRRA